MDKFLTIIAKLNRRLNSGILPGKEVQYQMAPPERPYDYPDYNNFNPAAVSILLYNKNNEIYFPLIQRTHNNLNDKHKGQISLPGGKLDNMDSDLYDCALRELEEELGIKNQNVNLVGKLTELYIPVSNFNVYPYVVYSDNSINFVPQPEEVQYVLEIPLRSLVDENRIKTGKIDLGNGVQLTDIPYFLLNNHIVWGATAMILNEFRDVIADY